jgi:hypothetical protein
MQGRAAQRQRPFLGRVCGVAAPLEGTPPPHRPGGGRARRFRFNGPRAAAPSVRTRTAWRRCPARTVRGAHRERPGPARLLQPLTWPKKMRSKIRFSSILF